MNILKYLHIKNDVDLFLKDIDNVLPKGSKYVFQLRVYQESSLFISYG